ncbi:low specificity L-threonine aldolase [Kluyveromyces marxianus]|uniref:low-specificity L-threonine aldolase n=2 Tax=Kluyveromyces marxianus TaxID=4911 RepID=W0T5T4_KLUMD|nr:low specificity L-threonine aldolase [Kluyveromyces marxianus DMKU3-1042]QGN13420.1 low specificity L-threonine aldolase [Kluyveromyces marxianus]BAO38403.1 low specificity L-threonine aldolase [Kluyveromyces marxianus DMKU3-1042]BAP69960.1 low specificity L-threonine aldolase [Kluyveromyces marxianus]
MSIPPLYTSSATDYRSDTFTIPTPDFWDLAKEASLGDTINLEDTDTCLLEAQISKEILGGKLFNGELSRGLFCMSTTMANQLAIRSHLNFAPPYSVLCDKRAHVYVDECAGIAVLSQALVIPAIATNDHHLTLEDIKANYVPDIGDIHLAPTRLICLENTLHGMRFPLEELERISEWAHSQNIKIHMDGARLWNAAAVDENLTSERNYMQRVASLVDSVSICLSKSIGAPIGSVLVGSIEFIKKARHIQKQQGGGIRQAGFITTIASYCIKKNFPENIMLVNQITESFWNDLSNTLKQEYNFELVLLHPVETNFIFIDLPKSKISCDVLLKFGEKNSVRLWDGRLAFHYQNISENSLNKLKQVFVDIAMYYKEHEFTVEERSARIY